MILICLDLSCLCLKLSLFGFDCVLMFMLQVFWDSPDRSHCGNNANILATFQCVMPV